MIRIIRLSVLLAGFLAPVTPSSAEPLDGVWRSQGYGYVFQIQGAAWKAFEVTSTTCVPASPPGEPPSQLPARRRPS